MDKLSITVGGRLYDTWWKVLQKDAPTTTHPSYPTSGKLNGAKSWRCASCHGWDYKGKEGIKGVYSLRGTDPAKILSVIRNDTHQYTPEMINDKAAKKIALFISAGLMDMGKYFDKTTGKAKGRPEKGVEIFAHVCAICHGGVGKKINFSGDKTDPEYVGTVANKERFLFLHRIRNGMPGQPMPSLITLPEQKQVDVLSYAQNLPINDEISMKSHEEEEHGNNDKSHSDVKHHNKTDKNSEASDHYYSEDEIKEFIKSYDH